MRVRLAVVDDLPAIVALIRYEDHVVEAGSMSLGPDYLAAFDEIDRDPRNEMLVLEDEDGELVGYMQSTYIPGLGKGGAERALFEAIRIRPDRRWSGHGRRLLGDAIARARARGCRHIELMSNKGQSEAHRFYCSLGFTPSHEGFKLDLPPDKG